MMDKLMDFVGRFHPVLVHLPIGFLLLAIILQWLSKKEKYAAIVPAINVAFLLGAISAAFSCITGLVLSSSGEYDVATLSLHKWMGISVAIISIVGYLFVKKPNNLIKLSLSIITVVLIIITGHLGGTLTHGEGFLTKGLSDPKTDSNKATHKAIANLQEAKIFSDIIQPIFNTKCGTCHSATKQKGGLRLDAQEWILKGGKDGQVYMAGNADVSELYKRIVLSPLDEKHMSPKGKPQLTEQEINLIRWWINSKAAFDKKVKEVEQPAEIKPALLALASAPEVKKTVDLPTEKVEPVSKQILDTLRKNGITVLPVALNSNYLLASFVSIPKPNDAQVSLLKLISKQLLWLQITGANISTATWKIVAGCNQLRRLHADHSNISDETLQLFTALPHLQYLNLVGTAITAQGMGPLKGLTKLENVFLGQTAIKTNDFLALQKMFPQAVLDSGNYHLEFIAADTMLLKKPVEKK
jgi:uncharacterized membrane protein